MSTLTRLIPLILLILVLAFAAIVGFVIYGIVTDIASKTNEKMEKKNISFSKEGMKVGVKEMQEENYVGVTQNMLVKAWNYSSWPAYRSRLGWGKGSTAGTTTGSRKGSDAAALSGGSGTASGDKKGQRVG
ncbi:hypothetical protein MMC25_003722 [Agyrium rufum]|nr:hypothetical protein [Agyrium rufum]